jgi:RNA polymerase sigma-70 factor (ECF subfamily)
MGAQALQTVEDLEALYDADKGVAYGLAFHLLRDQGASEDTVQEAFLSAWRSRGQYDPSKGALRTWLLAIVRNRAIDRLRHDRLRREAALDLETGDLSDASSDPALLSPERLWIRDALRSLPDAQRLAIKLAYYGGLTQTQIARRTRQPLGTVKGQLRLGLLKLAELDLSAGSSGAPIRYRGA